MTDDSNRRSAEDGEDGEDGLTGRRTAIVLGPDTRTRHALVQGLTATWTVATAQGSPGRVTSVVILAGCDAPLERVAAEIPDPERAVACLVDVRPRHVVLVCSAFVYGAYAGNAIPLSDSSLVRPDEGTPAVQRQAELQRRLEGYAADRGIGLTVLRCAPVVGPWPGGTSPFTDRERIGLKGPSAPAQFLHEQDLVGAVRHVLDLRLGGCFNVAPDGWLTVEEIGRITDLPDTLLDLPLNAYVRWRKRKSSGLTGGEVRARAAARRHPVVVANTAIRMSGWTPHNTNAMALRVADQADRKERKERARSRRRAAGPVAVLAIAAVAMAKLGYGRAKRSGATRVSLRRASH